jgi:3-methyladenine DNA glycosylase/8-oxoguanine DNA glycosylase
MYRYRNNTTKLLSDRTGLGEIRCEEPQSTGCKGRRGGACYLPDRTGCSGRRARYLKELAEKKKKTDVREKIGCDGRRGCGP